MMNIFFQILIPFDQRVIQIRINLDSEGNMANFKGEAAIFWGHLAEVIFYMF